MTLSDSTKSYNESGVFLQTLVYEELRKRNWNASVEHPVVVAPFRKNPMTLSHYWGGSNRKPEPENLVQAIRDSQNSFELSERSIDIIADRIIDSDRRIRLCIECKKLNPKYTEWCFFQQQELINRPHVIFTSRKNAGVAILFRLPKTTRYGNELFLSLERKFFDLEMFPKRQADFGIALTNQRLKGVFYNTEKTVVDQACRQIIEGTYGLSLESLISQILAGNAESYQNADIFIPIIVTNAKLKYCKFEPNKINPNSAHIEKEPQYDNIESITYEYNSPKTVQYPEPLFGDLRPDIRESTSKWYVLVMSPTGFVKFLDAIQNMWGNPEYL